MCPPPPGIRLLTSRNGYSLFEVIQRATVAMRDGHAGFLINGPDGFASEFVLDSDEAARRFLELAPIQSWDVAVMTKRIHLGEAEIRCFQSALHRIFRGEPWEIVEPHARRAWVTGQFADGTPWEDIHERIRSAFDPRFKTAT